MSSAAQSTKLPTPRRPTRPRSRGRQVPQWDHRHRRSAAGQLRRHNAVLASGFGAANASLLLSRLERRSDGVAEHDKDITVGLDIDAEAGDLAKTDPKDDDCGEDSSTEEPPQRPT